MDEDPHDVVRVVGAAVLRDGRVLAVRRTEPPRLAGRWEFPGGKVEPGESDEQGLTRELQEELGVDAQVHERVGPDLPIGARPTGGSAVLRVHRTTILGEPELREHDRLRWLGPDELGEVDWLPADLPVLPALRELLVRSGPPR